MVDKILSLLKELFGHNDGNKESCALAQQLQDEVKSLTDELASLKDANGKLSEKLSLFQGQLSEAHSTITTQGNQIQELTKKLESEKVEHKKSAEEVQRLKQEIETIRSQNKDAVDSLVSCIRNSGLLCNDRFSKEQVIDFFNNQFEQLLSIWNIEIYEDIGGQFNPTFHKIVATTYCDDKSKEGTISRSMGKGFRIGNKCIVEQPVEIFVNEL